MQPKTEIQSAACCCCCLLVVICCSCRCRCCSCCSLLSLPKIFILNLLVFATLHFLSALQGYVAFVEG